MGTLQCYFNHQTHEDPLRLPGQQDISAHVNFSQVYTQATSIGWQLEGYTTQAHYLLDHPLDDLVHHAPDTFACTQALKTLTLPHEMGELVKVMALSKHDMAPALGFNGRDESPQL